MKYSIKLIIFDYSGTLSPEMADFARPDNLLRQLQMSGLAAAGIDSADKFWQIVNDTWQEGSTTDIGYKKVMQARLLKLFPKADKSILEKAVSDLVDSYFAASRIDERWRPVLETLSGDKEVQVIIATDHYAEATDAIIGYLSAWNIAAVSVTQRCRGKFAIANSADIGFPKENPKYWEVIRNAFPKTYSRILMIDDFGANEQSADAYAQADKISERRQKTVNMLSNVFQTPVESLPFITGDTPFADLIANSSIKIRQFIS